MDFKEWIDRDYTVPERRSAYNELHYVPDVDLSLSNFRQFIEERKKLISNEFRKLST